MNMHQVIRCATMAQQQIVTAHARDERKAMAKEFVRLAHASGIERRAIESQFARVSCDR
jgi:hypothetical protein